MSEHYGLFLYDNNLDPDTVLMHRTLIENNLFDKMVAMPTGHFQTRQHLYNNTRDIHIVKFPCILVYSDDRNPKIYYKEELDKALKALNKLFNIN